MSTYEIISCIITSFAALFAGVAALFTYRNLKEIRNQFFEQNRGNLVLYVDKIKPGVLESFILKNYGNSPAKLISISISPDIDWKKSRHNIPDKFNISNWENIFLAPRQFVYSDFDFKKYPDQIFGIALKYETMGKLITETYTIDLHFSHQLVETNLDISNELNALKNINESIQQLSWRFL